MRRALLAVAAMSASCLVAVSPAVADPAPVYCGANDVVMPKVGAVSVSPTSVVIGRANKKLTVTVAASDDCGIDRIFAQVYPRGVETPYFINLSQFTRVSGTQKNGVWRSSVTINDGAVGGVWSVLLVDVYDTYFGFARRYNTPATIHIRHETSLKLNNPRDKVYKTVTLVGRLRAYGDSGTWKVKIQSHKPGKKWKTVHTVTTNGWGDFSKKITITGTTYFRAVHAKSNTTVGSTSKSYKVKKR